MKIKFKYKRELLIGLIVALLILMITSKFFIIANIPSESMCNTLEVGDKVLVSTSNFILERGKIYVFNKDNMPYIKRCIGLEGDHIVIKNDDVYVNGKLLTEDYVSSKVKGEINIDIVVPNGKVFFLGDNRAVSYDARYWKDKFISVNDIEGEALKILFPFKRISDI